MRKKLRTKYKYMLLGELLDCGESLAPFEKEMVLLLVRDASIRDAIERGIAVLDRPAPPPPRKPTLNEILGMMYAPAQTKSGMKLHLAYQTSVFTMCKQERAEEGRFANYTPHDLKYGKWSSIENRRKTVQINCQTCGRVFDKMLKDMGIKN